MLLVNFHCIALQLYKCCVFTLLSSLPIATDVGLVLQKVLLLLQQINLISSLHFTSLCWLAQVSAIKPDNFTPTVVQQTADYLYAEFQSPTFGFIDDVEFWFPANKQKDGIVEYRSASRIGESDGDINRKRIKAIRLQLEKKGWKSIGFS